MASSTAFSWMGMLTWLMGPLDIATDLTWLALTLASAFWTLVMGLAVCAALLTQVSDAWLSCVGYAWLAVMALALGRVAVWPSAATGAAPNFRGALGAMGVRIGTYNLRNENIPDGVDAWAAGRNALARRTLYDMQCDIVGTQEGTRAMLDYLVASDPSWKWFGEVDSPNGSCHDSAILYNSEVVSVSLEGTRWMSPTPTVRGTKFPTSAHVRMVSWGLFTWRARRLDSGAPLRVLFVNTHLDHLGELARQQQARVIRELIDELRAAHELHDVPVVVTGDFNALRRSAAWRVMTDASGAFRAPLVDTWEVAPLRPAATRLSFHGFMGLKGEAWTLTAFLRAAVSLGSLLTSKAPLVWMPSDFHIDWVLTSPAVSGSSWRPLVSEIVSAHEGDRYPSDHYPIVVTFEAK